MPALVRLYIRQCLIGFAISAAFVAGLLWLNVANLQHLVFAAQGGYLALFLLFFFNGLVFASVQFAIAVMGMAERRDRDGGRPAALPMADAFAAVPARVGDGVRNPAAARRR